MKRLQLIAVTIVCRYFDVDAINHVPDLISDMLDTSSRWTLHSAAANGYTTLVKRILHRNDASALVCDVKAIEQALTQAAANGHLGVVETLLDCVPHVRVADAMEETAIHGHVHVLSWLHDNSMHANQRMTLHAMDSAAVNGHLAVLKWMHQHRPEGCTTRAMDGAARAARLDIVRWLHENRQDGCTTQAMDGAAAMGHLEMVQWLHANRTEGCSTMALVLAGLNGHSHVVEWLQAAQRDLNLPLNVWRGHKQQQTPVAAIEFRSATLCSSA